MTLSIDSVVAQLYWQGNMVLRPTLSHSITMVVRIARLWLSMHRNDVT